MTLEELENKRTEKQKELIVEQDYYSDIEASILLKQREILELQIEKKKLEEVLSKSSKNVKKLKIEIAMLTNEFWSKKNG